MLNRFTMLILATFTGVLLSSCSGQKGESMQQYDPNSSEVISLRSGDLVMKIAPHIGGRVVEFSLNGKNVLVSKGDMFGSTFWLSPQSTWVWPPSAEIDNLPYTINTSSEQNHISSQVDSQSGLQVEKRFAIEDKTGCFIVTYVIYNPSEKSVKVAPWEISRVHGGLSFYPGLAKPQRDEIGIEHKEGINYYDYQPSKLPESHATKAFDNASQGWIANANRDTNLLFIKTFSNINLEQVADKEGEIEIYASKNQSYVEIEQQGKVVQLKPKQSFLWEVKWHLLPLNEKDPVEQVRHYLKSL